MSTIKVPDPSVRSANKHEINVSGTAARRSREDSGYIPLGLEIKKSVAPAFDRES
jgi:hypothetical protein